MTFRPVIIVTGASRGLGAAIACWLAKTGAGVALIARSGEKLGQTAEAVRQLGGESLIQKTDVSDPDACMAAVTKTVAHFGRLDALVNNAGIVQPIAPIATADPNEWRYNIGVNIMGPFYLTQASVPELRNTKGRIVNVSSGAANLALANISAYCASKAALNHFTAVLAAEEPSITALAVRPGVVDTEMQTFIRTEGPKAMPSDQVRYYTALKERGELEPPEIPARSIAWLTLHAPVAFNGKFFDYDDPRISRPSVEAFGEHL
jgi:NAD(P)-dependent dehydrogenase (short-subunit alcohol dehydrogenase family)